MQERDVKIAKLEKERSIMQVARTANDGHEVDLFMTPKVYGSVKYATKEL